MHFEVCMMYPTCIIDGLLDSGMETLICVASHHGRLLLRYLLSTAVRSLHSLHESIVYRYGSLAEVQLQARQVYPFRVLAVWVVANLPNWLSLLSLPPPSLLLLQSLTCHKSTSEKSNREEVEASPA